ncbi:MAG: YhbY family RNA-binding protein [Archaeoglobi archaeon]|nr:YhbY family RNA-binding protein [Candidatus Mnemosynella sp.]
MNAVHSKPHVQIGKSGLTEGVIEEIKRQLEDKKVIKIRFMRSITKERDVEELVREIAIRTGCEIEDVRGRTAVIKKLKKGGLSK